MKARILGWVPAADVHDIQSRLCQTEINDASTKARFILLEYARTVRRHVCGERVAVVKRAAGEGGLSRRYCITACLLAAIGLPLARSGRISSAPRSRVKIEGTSPNELCYEHGTLPRAVPET